MHLRPGCTGRIGKLVIVQRSGDGLKVTEGAHDLVVGGGSIRCLAKAPRFHQDGIQVLGGARITFHGLKISCGRRDERLINANLFINQGGRSRLPPRDIVCRTARSAPGPPTLSASSAHCVRRDPLDAVRRALPAADPRRGDDARDPQVSDNHVRHAAPAS